MQTGKNCDKLVVQDGWLFCPACGKSKVLKLRIDTRAENLIVHCKKCGRESVVDIACLCQCQSASA